MERYTKQDKDGRYYIESANVKLESDTHGRTYGASIDCFAELENNHEAQQKKINDLEYTLLGVMHSVDKWLEGDELNQDEVNRAAAMREKTLKIIEDATREVDFLRTAKNLRVAEKNKINGMRITREKVIELLGRRQYLSGIARSAFHSTAVRETENGEFVHFDSSKLFKNAI